MQKMQLADMKTESSQKLRGIYAFLWRILNGPVFIRRSFAAALASLLYLAQKKRLHKRIHTLFPAFDKQKAGGIAKASTRDSCRQIMDMLVIPDMPYRIEGLELLPPAGEQGAVFASLHLGQTEAPTYAIKQQGYEVCTIIGAGEDNPQLHHLGAAMLEAVDLPYLTKGKGILFELIARLRKKQCVFVHCDLRDQGLETTFMGQQTTFPQTAASLAVLARVPLYFIYGIEQESETVIYIEKLAVPEEIAQLEIPREEAITLFTQRVISKMEQVICTYPERWLWLYNRFGIK